MKLSDSTWVFAEGRIVVSPIDPQQNEDIICSCWCGLIWRSPFRSWGRHIQQNTVRRIIEDFSLKSGDVRPFDDVAFHHYPCVRAIADSIGV